MNEYNPRHIFIDTNIIIGAYLLQKKDDLDCLRYLFSISGRGIKLFVSSLSLAQFISTSQKNKKLERTSLKETIDRLSNKCTVIDFLHTDIDDAFRHVNEDIEDNIQFVIGKKKKCQYFITNNKKDYSFFNIFAISSKECRRKILKY